MFLGEKGGVAQVGARDSGKASILTSACFRTTMPAYTLQIVVARSDVAISL
jgi:hypothetical protein